MSDPVKSNEFEDVLSSIRRLVSTDDAREDVAVAPDAAPEEEPFVLTQSQRVSDAAEAGEPQTDEALEVAEEGPEPDYDMPWLRPVADHEANTEGDEDIYDDEEDTSDHHAEDLSEDNYASFANEHDADDEAHAEGYDAKANDLGEEIAEDDHSLEDAEFEDDTAVIVEDENTNDDDPWTMGRSADVTTLEPDAPGDSEYAGTEVRPLSWQDESAQAEDASPDSVEEASIELNENFSDVSEINEPIEMDAPSFTAADPVSDDELLSDLEPESVEETLLDEEALQELVAEIVRRELQGPLGERITRNVRKLVRREIHRALAAHDLS